MFSTAKAVQQAAQVAAGQAAPTPPVLRHGFYVTVPAVTVPGPAGCPAAVTWRAGHALCAGRVALVRNTYGRWRLYLNAAKAGQYLYTV